MQTPKRNLLPWPHLLEWQCTSLITQKYANIAVHTYKLIHGYASIPTVHTETNMYVDMQKQAGRGAVSRTRMSCLGGKKEAKEQVGTIVQKEREWELRAGPD